MQRRERQFARLLRALIACCALLLAGPAPLPVAPAGDVSSWLVAQVSAPAPVRVQADTRRVASRVTRSAAAVVAPAFPPLAAEPRALREQLRARRDGRHLYLEIQTLLC